MRNILKRKSIYIILLMGLFLLFSAIEVKAASATINCSDSVEVNSPIKITVSGTGVQWKLKLIVDGQVIAQSSELENYQSNKNISFSGTYTPTTKGTKTVKLEGSVTEFSDGSTIVNFAERQITVKEKTATPPPSTPEPSSKPEEEPPAETNPTPTPKVDTPTLSSNNQLSSLKVSEGTLSPKFSARTKEYTVEVGEDVESIKITASKSHDKATVSGTGTKKLNPGVNVFEIQVTAENGSVNTYKITVNKPQPKEEEEKELELKLKSLIVKGVNTDRQLIDLTYSPEFSEEVYSYEMNVEDNIESLTVEALVKEEGTIVEILGNENLVVGENVVTIMLKTADGEKSATYQIVVNKEEPKIAQAVVATPEEIPEDISKSDHWMLIIGAAGIIALVIGTIIIVITHKREKTDNLTPIEEVEEFTKTKKEKKQKKNQEIIEEKDSEKGKGRGRHF